MKKLIVTVGFCLFSKMVFSQSEVVLEKKDTTIDKQALERESDDIIFDDLPVPEFIGGHNAMFKFLSTNIKMLKFDSLRSVNLDRGCYTVYISFLVSKNGEIQNVKTKRGIKDYPEFEEEAVRVIKMMDGKWKAGKQNGEFIDVNFTLPIKFTIE